MPEEDAAGRPGWLPPIALWAAVTGVLLTVSYIVLRQGDFDQQALPVVRFDGDGFWGGWCRYDCGWYTFIADQGYHHNEGTVSPVAFFPGYPLAMRAVGRVIGDVTLGGVFVTLGCGLAALVLFWRWCLARMPRSAALTSLALFALYPYAWYLYGAVYGDAFFVVTALGAFLLLEHDRPVLAGIVAVASTATRAVGVAVVLGLVLLVLERRGAFVGRRRGGLPRRVELRALRPGDTGVLIGFAGLAAWCLYLWNRFGDPFLFSSVQQYWGQPANRNTWFKANFIDTVLHGDDRVYSWGIALQATLTVAALVAAWFVAKRFGVAYGAYVVVLVGIPAIGSHDFQGCGRYLIGAFPVFALLGEVLDRRRALAFVVLGVFAVGIVAGTAMFSHGIYIS